MQSKKSNKQMKLLDTEVRWLSEEKAVERWAKQVKEVNFMVTNGNEIYCGDHFLVYTKTELLCFTHETKYNIIYQFSLNVKKKKMKQNSKLQ